MEMLETAKACIRNVHIMLIRQNIKAYPILYSREIKEWQLFHLD